METIEVKYFNAAHQIREQLGHKALYMLGAKNLGATDRSLSFKIGRNSKKVNYIKITLEPSDTYRVEFLNIRDVLLR